MLVFIYEAQHRHFKHNYDTDKAIIILKNK